jgi:23S rRNA (uridine2552-2'-O)-methyltransferase
MNKRDQPDHYTQMAHRAGYPARSVYKLEEIQNKHKVLKPGMNVLDLGAAPGSWSLYVSRLFGGRGKILAVDLNPLGLKGTPSGITALQGNFFDPEIRRIIRENGPYDAVLSDAAPQTTGNRLVDTGRSFELVTGVLEIARENLKRGGSLVTKVFEGGDEREIFKQAGECFKTVKKQKPAAVRKESMEHYMVALDFSLDKSPDHPIIE